MLWTKTNLTEVFEDHNIDFHFCEEDFVNHEFYHNPPLFLDNGICDIYFDPDYIHIYLLGTCSINGDDCAGRAEDIGNGANRSYSTGGTLPHEMGHLLNLAHIGGCPSVLQGWVMGDPLSPADRDDFVADTPIAPDVEVDTILGVIKPIYQSDSLGMEEYCFVDYSKSEACTQSYPENYCFTQAANGTLVYNNVWESNLMTNFWRGTCGPNDEFTNGQGERMYDYLLDGSGQTFVNYGESCPSIIVSLPVLTNQDLVSGATFNGEYKVTQNLVLATDVTFSNLTLFFMPDVKLEITSSGNLTCINGTFKSDNTCNQKWGGITALPGANVDFQISKIYNANIGLTLNSHLANLDFVSFVDCTKGMIVDYDWGWAITTNDLNFYESPVDIIDSPIKLHGGKFYKSNLTTTANSSIFLSQGEARGRATFLQSQVTFTGKLLHIANGYFDRFSPIIVNEAENVDICWSYFDGATLLSSIRAQIDMEEVDTYRIYGCQFYSNEHAVSILPNSVSTTKSLVNNNIFFGNINEDPTFLTVIETFVELSCNFHEVNGQPAYQMTPSGFATQGRSDHPIGNQFLGTTPSEIDIYPSFPFIYFYNENNELYEMPKLVDDGDLDRIGIDFDDESLCMTRDEIVIAGSWDSFFGFFCHTNPRTWRDHICTCPPPPPTDPPTEIGVSGKGGDAQRNRPDEGIGYDLAADETKSNSGAKVEYNIGGDIRVSTRDSNSNMEFILTDVLGNTIKKASNLSALRVINIYDLPSGIYIAYIKDENGVLQISQIIQHTK